MALPTIFTDSGDKPLASFDWYDAYTGNAYNRFYLANATDSAATTYFVTTKTLTANTGSVSYSSNNTVLQLRNDTDFDILFNSPQRINGTANLNFTVRYENKDTGRYSTVYLVITIYHVSVGGAETSLGTVTTPTRAGNGSSSVYTNYMRECVQIALAEKYMQIGEKLRINVLHYHGSIGIANSSSGYYIEPTNSLSLIDTGDTISKSSTFTVDIPFRIEM